MSNETKEISERITNDIQRLVVSELIHLNESPISVYVNLIDSPRKSQSINGMIILLQAIQRRYYDLEDKEYCAN